MKNIQQTSNLLSLIAFSVILHTFSSCSSKHELKQAQKSTRKISLEFDSLKIQLDSLQLTDYHVFSSFENSSVSEFWGYNTYTHTLDGFDLHNNKNLQSIRLEKEGPNGIGTVESVGYYKRDSIFLFSTGYLHIIDSNGFRIDRFDLRTLNNKTNCHSNLISNWYFKIKYSPLRKSVLLYNLIPFDLYEKCADLSLISELNLSTRKLTDFAIPSYNYFTSLGKRVGFLSLINCEGIEDNGEIYYNYQFSPEIFNYSPSKGFQTINGKPFNAKFSQEFRELVDTDNDELWTLNALENTHHFEILHDQHRNVLYRFSWGGLDEKRADGKYNTMMDKPVLLSVYDASDYSLILEHEIPASSVRINTWFVNKEGLWFSNLGPLKENVDYSAFELFCIKINEE